MKLRKGFNILFAALAALCVVVFALTLAQDYYLILKNVLELKTSATDEDVEVLSRLKGPVPYDSPALLQVIRSKYLEPPSSLPYNLTDDNVYDQYKSLGIYVSAMHVVRYFFHNKTNGIFVEAGALDGQFLSNTLDLEKFQGWTGLLVEAGELNYIRILQKRRKAWVSHSCLALHPYPHTAILGTKLQSDPDWNLMLKGQAALLQSRTSDERLHDQLVSYESVQCLPTASLLLALNFTHIDFFSLDVEDVEDAILDSFPFDRITVDVWYIEHRHPNSSVDSFPIADTAFIEKFWQRGYTNLPLNGDYLFVRNGSEYAALPPINPFVVVKQQSLSYSVQYMDATSEKERKIE